MEAEINETSYRVWPGSLPALMFVVAAAACSRGQGNVPSAADSGAQAVKAGTVALPALAARENPVTRVKVTRAALSHDLELVGSVAAGADHLAVVGPLIDGRVAALHAKVGDAVRRGELLAELESPTVGEAQSAYLAALAHAHAAKANVKREVDLAAKRISAEREREVAIAQSDVHEAEVAAARDRLVTIGFGEADIKQIELRRLRPGRLPMRAPIDGTVIARHVTVGQAVERAKDAFTIANLDQLWVMLSVYEKDLRKVSVGQRAVLRADTLLDGPLEARVGYVEATVNPDTRTARVRVQVDNRQRHLRIGQLVTARLIAESAARAGAPPLVVPRAAVVRLDGQDVAFVEEAGAWRRQPVEVGVRVGDSVEILGGLTENDTVATDGAFLLKSEALR